MRIRDYQKSKGMSYKHENYLQNYKKKTHCSLAKIDWSSIGAYMESKRSQNRQNRDQLRLSYKMCQGKKARIMKKHSYMPGDVLDLIDKFRSILDKMLEDEAGSYPSEEILNVSRALDDMIFYYYNSSLTGEKLQGTYPEGDIAEQ